MIPSLALCALLTALIVLTGRLTEGRRDENRLRGRATALSELAEIPIQEAFKAVNGQSGEFCRTRRFGADGSGIPEPMQADYRQAHGILGAWSINEEAAAILFRGSGLWGPMTAMILVRKPEGAMEDNHRGTMTLGGLRILENSETPSLGGKIADPKFLSGFAGLPIGRGGDVKVDTITGATQTCLRLKKMLERALAGFFASKEGQGLVHGYPGRERNGDAGEMKEAGNE